MLGNPVVAYGAKCSGESAKMFFWIRTAVMLVAGIVVLVVVILGKRPADIGKGFVTPPEKIAPVPAERAPLSRCAFTGCGHGWSTPSVPVHRLRPV